MIYGLLTLSKNLITIFQDQQSPDEALKLNSSYKVNSSEHPATT
jgi:hypothetical protein